MAIPSTVEATAAGYIGYLGSQINLAEKLWTHYAWVVSAAYAAAYELNKRVLDKVKQAGRKLSGARITIAWPSHSRS